MDKETFARRGILESQYLTMYSWIKRRLPYIAVTLLFVVCLGFAHDARYGFTKLIRFGDWFETSMLDEARELPVYVFPDSYGYDGQFYAQLSCDPFFTDAETLEAIDNPAYRGRRILASLVSYVLGGGSPWALQVYALLNPICWFLFAFLIYRWTRGGGAYSFLRWLGCVLSIGSISSVLYALLDLPGALLAFLGLYFVEKSRLKSATASFAAAVLTKETAILSAFGAFSNRDWKQRFWIPLAAIVPFALWVGYLHLKAMPMNAGNSSNFQLPFSGLWAEIQAAWGYMMEGKIYSAFAIVALLYQVAYLVSHPRFESPVWRSSIPYILLMLVLGHVVWEGDPGAAYRVLLPIAVAFNLELRTSRLFVVHWLIGNASLLVGVRYLLKIALL